MKPAIFRRYLKGTLLQMAEGDAGGGGSVDWKSSLPETVQEWDEAKNAKDVDSFWDQIANHRSMLGQSIQVPGKDAGEEAWQKFNTKLQAKVPTLINKPDLSDPEQRSQFYGSLGKPEAPDKYSMPQFENAEDLNLKPAEEFRDVAYEADLTQTQYETIVQKITEKNLIEHANTMQKVEEDKLGLQKEWGFAYEQNLKKVENFLIQAGAPEPLIEIAKNKGMDMASNKFFYDLATKVMGEGVHAGVDSNPPKDAPLTPEQATIKISEIMNNKKHPYWNKRDAAHKLAKAEMRRLYEYKLGKDARKPAPGSGYTEV